MSFLVSLIRNIPEMKSYLYCIPIQNNVVFVFKLRKTMKNIFLTLSFRPPLKKITKPPAANRFSLELMNQSVPSCGAYALEL